MNTAIVVLYRPTAEQIFKVRANAVLFDETYIVDNSETPNSSAWDGDTLAYFHNANQGGIAGAYNRALANLDCKSQRYIFTLDQDTELPSEYCTDMVAFAEEQGALVCCPDFIDVNSRTRAGFAVLTRFGYRVNRDATTDFCISSGMCFDASIFEQVRFDERLTIDHVDTDICLKLKELSVDIFVNRRVVLKHAIGTRSKRSFAGLRLTPTNHLPVRRYYIVRNGWYLAFKYWHKYPGFFVLNFNRTAHEFLCVVLYEKQKFEKLKMMAYGLTHAVVKKLGKY